MDNQNVEVAGRLIAAFQADDRAAIHRLVDPDCVLQPPREALYFGDYRGPEGFLKFADCFIKLFDLQRMENTNTFQSSDPDVMVLEFALKGKVRASGEPLDTTILELWKFRNGKIAGIKAHWFDLPR